MLQESAPFSMTCLRMRSHRKRLAPGSMPVEGSSMSTTAGLPTRATATLSLRLLPPLYDSHTLESGSTGCQKNDLYSVSRHMQNGMLSLRSSGHNPNMPPLRHDTMWLCSSPGDRHESCQRYLRVKRDPVVADGKAESTCLHTLRGRCGV